MDMVKEIKKNRFNLKVFLVALLLVVVAGIFIALQRGKILEDSKSILEKQRFIETYILSGVNNEESISAVFDLKDKEFFLLPWSCNKK
jgi:anaerobic C4-dicarboxylate transporter